MNPSDLMEPVVIGQPVEPIDVVQYDIPLPDFMLAEEDKIQNLPQE